MATATRLEGLVAAVTKRFGLGMRASTPGHGLFLGNVDFEGGVPGAFVRAVAEGLALGGTAGAPVLGAGFSRLNDGKLLKDNGV